MPTKALENTATAGRTSQNGAVALVVGRYEWHGETYVGQTRLGKSEGHGVYQWPGGSTYRGQFKEGK